MSQKFEQIKMQRAIQKIAISKHQLFIPYKRSINDPPDVGRVYVQEHLHKPLHERPAPICISDGTIYVISRNVPTKRVQGGTVLLLNLERAAACLADDTHEIATEAQIASELERQEIQRKEFQETNRHTQAMSNGYVQNMVEAPNVVVNFQVPKGFRMVSDDSEDDDSDTPKPVRQRGKARTTPTADPSDQTGE